MPNRLRIALLLAAQATWVGFAQEQAVPESLVKARFLARIAEYSEWPSSSGVLDRSIPFRIGILGKTGIEASLKEEIQSLGTLKGKPVEIKFFRTISRIDQCEILFVGESEQDRLDQIVKFLDGKPVLTIADSVESAQKGIMFCLFVKQNRLVYEVNLAALRAVGLQIESRVLARGTIVKR